MSTSLHTTQEQPAPVARLEINIVSEIGAQLEFWQDTSRIRAFVGGVGSGKSFAGVVEVLRQPPRTVGLISAPTYPMLRDSTQRTFFELCPPALISEHNKSENRTELANGSTILWRSADDPDRLRGPNLSWAYVDECAYVSEDVWRVIIGRLRRAPGRAWATTTPAGHNWFFNWFMLEQPDYSVHFGRTSANPYNLAGYAESLARQFEGDPTYAAQELDGQFVDTSSCKRFPGALLASVYEHKQPLAFSCPESIRVASRTYTIPASARVYERPKVSSSYVIGADCAEGLPGGDDSTCVVIDKHSGDLALVLSGEYEPKEEHPSILACASRWYNGAPVMVERNNHGHAVLGALSRHGIVCLAGLDGRVGWNTTSSSKSRAFGDAQSHLMRARDDGCAILFDAHLKTQLGSIDRATLKPHRKGKGATKVDDECIAWVLAQCARASSPIASARSRKAMAHLFRGSRRR